MTLPVVDDLVALIESIVSGNRQKSKATTNMATAQSKQEVDRIYNALPDALKQDPEVAAAYTQARGWKPDAGEDVEDPLTKFISGALDDWLAHIEKYSKATPENAKENLSKLSAQVIKVAGVSAAIDIGLGMLPNTAGITSATNSKQLLAWLGFGAVLAAVAHDPVKIGLLRPYQDSLEQTFRNRRPDDFALFQAYRTRELTPTKFDIGDKNPDAAMDAIEVANDEFYNKEIAKWGYSEWFAGALARSATRTLNFSQLNALARQGLLSRGLAIYSLWGEGLDRTVMKPALDALMQQNEIASYDGFRAQIERGYTDGLVTLEELKVYYAKLHVPEDVQKVMLPHMTKLREDAKKKAASTAAGPQRDLTVSQVQQAYEAGLLERTKAQNMILVLGYSLDETKLFLELVDTRKKLPVASRLKRLTLTDYEKAFKAKLISQEAVLARMQDEYTAEDIALEKKLLEAGKA